MIRRLIAIIAAGAGLALTASPAGAQPTATTRVEVTDASQGSCSNGSAVWRVQADITITNGSSADIDEIVSVTYSAKYSVSGVSGQTTTNATTVIDAGGLVPGVQIAPGDSQTFSVFVDVTLPCNADTATLFVRYDLVNGHKTFQGGDQFLSSGTPVPVGAIGSVSLAALAAAGLVLSNRRSKRKAGAST